nr:STAS domain-containing protein [Sporosarcina sp. HYO08]
METTDTFVVQQLYYLFKTFSLLGIQAMTSGISPAIAQTMVNLGLSFGKIKSFATPKQALAHTREKNAA